MAQVATLGLARWSDGPAIAEMSRDLIEHGLPWTWTAARVRRHICGSESSVVVARRQGRIAAFAIMQFGEQSAHLNLLAVAGDQRRQGLGRQLMEWLTHTALEAGVFRVDLEVRVQNGVARLFYRSLGYEERDLVPGYYQGREGALRMTRSLSVLPAGPAVP